MSGYSRVREALLGALRRRTANAELSEELRFHRDMEAERLVREEGLGVAEARRRAAVLFGGVEKHAEAVKDARGAAWLPGLTLDFRLGLRMMARSWGVTLVGGLGMALAITLGAVFQAVTRVVEMPLPLPDGGSIVAVEVWDAAVSNQERRILADFGAWRGELRTIHDLSAYRTVGRNLIMPDGTAEPVPVAEITASAFSVAATPPLLGRTLIAEDEAPGASPVLVLGHDAWRERFASDPAVIGRFVDLGTVEHMVVGVMPAGFRFPINHQYWAALQVDPASLGPLEGPTVHLFGRLSRGATPGAASAELATLSARSAAANPDLYRHLGPRVMPYTSQLFDDMQGWEIPSLHVLLLLLLTVVSANVAVLMYARTATRAGEIAVRAALGASRARIMSQLFVEALVLAGLAAAVGLLGAHLLLGRFNLLLARFSDGALGGAPFWLHFSIGPSTVFYVLLLAVVAAVVTGVVPAMRAAGGQVQAALRQLGGATGPRLGRTWTLLIVAQVAITVAVMPVAFSAGWKTVLHGAAQPGFAAEEFVGGWLALERHPDTPIDAHRARYTELRLGLQQRLDASRTVGAATFSTSLPGQEETVKVLPEDAAEVVSVRFARVALNYFDVFGVPVLSGRTLLPGDATESATAVVISRTLAAALAPAGNALGRRFRYEEGYRSGGTMRTPAGVNMERWYEVVGVVPDFPNAIDPDESTARVYHALAPGELATTALLARTAGTTTGQLARELRTIAAGLDPALQLRNPRPLDDVMREMQGTMRIMAVGLAAGVLSVLLLSAAGIYALMSFVVARRRREIGIRSALGAAPRRILWSVFSRAGAQLAAGAGAGLTVALLLELGTGGALLDGRGTVLMPLVAVVMLAVGLVATLGPARAGLRVQPSEALKQE